MKKTIIYSVISVAFIFEIVAGILSSTAKAPIIQPQIMGTSTEQEVNYQQEVQVDYIVQSLINCESGGRSVAIVDSNGYYSRGILQFQKATWNMFSKESGITGDPMNPDDAIKMARWAVLHGYGKHWTCWQKVPQEMRLSTSTND